MPHARRELPNRHGHQPGTGLWPDRFRRAPIHDDETGGLGGWGRRDALVSLRACGRHRFGLRGLRRRVDWRRRFGLNRRHVLRRRRRRRRSGRCGRRVSRGLRGGALLRRTCRGRRWRGECLGHRRGIRRVGSAARREERERVEIAVRIRRQADAEVEVRHRLLGLAGGADRADRLPLGHRSVLGHTDRAQVNERDGVPVVGLDRDAEPVRRHRARERDPAGPWSERRLAGAAADVDPAMLPAGVRVIAEPEGLEHRSGYRPRPRGRRGRDGERAEHEGGGRTQERQHVSQRRLGVPPLSIQITVLSQRSLAFVTKSGGTACSATRR